MCSQSCMALLSADPAASAAPAPTKPRRLSMRSIPVNSVRTAAVRSGAHGRPSGCSTLPSPCRFPVRPCRTNPRSSMVTTRPRRSVNRAASTLRHRIARGLPHVDPAPHPRGVGRQLGVAHGRRLPVDQPREFALGPAGQAEQVRRVGCWVLRSRQAPRFSAELTVARLSDAGRLFARVRQGAPDGVPPAAGCQVGTRHPDPVSRRTFPRVQPGGPGPGSARNSSAHEGICLAHVRSIVLRVRPAPAAPHLRPARRRPLPRPRAADGPRAGRRRARRVPGSAPSRSAGESTCPALRARSCARRSPRCTGSARSSPRCRCCAAADAPCSWSARRDAARPSPSAYWTTPPRGPSGSGTK